MWGTDTRGTSSGVPPGQGGAAPRCRGGSYGGCGRAFQRVPRGPSSLPPPGNALCQDAAVRSCAPWDGNPNLGPSASTLDSRQDALPQAHSCRAQRS